MRARWLDILRLILTRHETIAWLWWWRVHLLRVRHSILIVHGWLLKTLSHHWLWVSWRIPSFKLVFRSWVIVDAQPLDGLNDRSGVHVNRITEGFHLDLGVLSRCEIFSRFLGSCVRCLLTGAFLLLVVWVLGEEKVERSLWTQVDMNCVVVRTTLHMTVDELVTLEVRQSQVLFMDGHQDA